MAQNVQITCINKIPRQDPNESITRIGGRNPDGSPWNLPLQEAINGIESGKWKFYVREAGKITWVVIAESRSGNKYLRTESDSTTRNNLLSLPEC
ncbi:DUF3892 domain-containing protein [Alcaligenes faecalis]|uniref:DUF3892 domain-containing protein n=1 Tax=Alcaligenes faecalis TaxID=511 RepID=UPI003555E6EA